MQPTKQKVPTPTTCRLPRVVSRTPSLDFSSLEHDHSSPFWDLGRSTDINLNMTLIDAETRSGARLLAITCNAALNRTTLAQLRAWSAMKSRAHSEEACEAIDSLVENIAKALFLDEHWSNSSEASKKSKVLSFPLKDKAVSETLKHFLDFDDEDDNISSVLNDILKASGDVLEDRCRCFLEAQGVMPWSEEAGIIALAKIKENEDEPLFYVTENELRAQQEEKYGEGNVMSTPDFLLVDASGIPVRVPCLLHKRPPCNSGEGSQDVDFYATVVEVKGHFVFSGLYDEVRKTSAQCSTKHRAVARPEGWVDDDDEYAVRKIADQLRRYGAWFGPPLMLQKHGMCAATLRTLAAAMNSERDGVAKDGKRSGAQVVSTAATASDARERRPQWPLAVLPVNISALPHSNLPNSRTACTYSDDKKFSTEYGKVLSTWSQCGGSGGSAALSASAAREDIALLLELKSQAEAFVQRHSWGRRGTKDHALRNIFGGWRGRMLYTYMQAAREAVAADKSVGGGGGDVRDVRDVDGGRQEHPPLAALATSGEVLESWEDAIDDAAENDVPDNDGTSAEACFVLAAEDPGSGSLGRDLFAASLGDDIMPVSPISRRASLLASLETVDPTEERRLKSRFDWMARRAQREEQEERWEQWRLLEEGDDGAFDDINDRFVDRKKKDKKFKEKRTLY